MSFPIKKWWLSIVMLVYQRVLQHQGAFGTSSLRHRMMFCGVLQSIAYTRGNACLISNVGVHSSPSHQTHISICGLDLWDSREWPDWDWKLFLKCELNGHPRRIQNNQKTYTNNTKPIHETRQRQKKNHTQLTTSISNKTHLDYMIVALSTRTCGSCGSC